MPQVLQITLELDDQGTPKLKGFSGAVRGAESATAQAAKKMESNWKRVERSISGLHNRIKRFATSLPGILGVAGLGAGVAKIISMSAKQEEIFRRLQFQVETTGVSYAAAKGQIDAFLSSMQNTTRFGDTDMAPVLGMITQLTGSLSKGLIGAKLAADLASSGMFDLRTAGRYVANAMQGNVEMLGRYIPELRRSSGLIKENMSAAQKWAVAQELLNKKFGGAAQADLNTFAGALKRLRNYVGDILERIGDILTQEFAGKISQWADAVKRFIESGKLEEWASGAARKVKEMTMKVGMLMKMLVSMTPVLGKFATAFIVLGAAVEASMLIMKIKRLTMMFMMLLSGPSGWLIVGLITLAAVIYKVIERTIGWAKTLEVAGKAMKTAWTILKSFGAFMLDWVKNTAQLLVGFGKIWQGVFTLSFSRVKEGFEQIKKAPVRFLETVKARFLQTKFAVSSVWDKIEEKTETATESMKNNVEAVNRTIRKMPEAVKQAIISIGKMREAFRGPELIGKLPSLPGVDPLQADKDRQTLVEIWRQTHQDQLAITDTFVRGFQTAWGTILDTEMTGKQRREEIWRSMKASFVQITGDMLSEWIRAKAQEFLATRAAEISKTAIVRSQSAVRGSIGTGELFRAMALKAKEGAVFIGVEIKKTAAFLANSAKRVAAMAAEVIKYLALGAAAMAQAAAELFRKAIAKLGPLGIILGIGGAAALAVAWKKIKSSFGFYRGGLIPEAVGLGPAIAAGRDRVPIMAEPGEFVVRREVVQQVGVATLSRLNRTGQLGGSVVIQGDTVVIQGGGIDSRLLAEIQAIKQRSREQLRADLEYLLKRRRLQLA